MKQSDQLYVEIQELIDSQREGDYWDFKQYHHANTADLLHDIICMANNRVDRDAYIIFGVEDGTFNITGVEKAEQRRNQQQMIDQLKSKKFAAGIRPTIEMHTIIVGVHELDVLIVKNTLDTPYYLVEDYQEQGRKVRANHIYTRICDTNTDIDKSADFNHVEYLWKKRFALHMTPYDKLKHLLQQKDEWIHDEKSHYHISNPEFTITFEDDEFDNDARNPMFYSYVMTNHSTSYGMLKANYFGTTLYSHQTVTLDSGRYTTVVPNWTFLRFAGEYRPEPVGFKCFVKEDISYLLHDYLFNEDSHEACYARNRFLEVILIFESEFERTSFIEYANRNEEMYIELLSKVRNVQIYAHMDYEEARAKYIDEIKAGIAFNKMLTLFREDNMNRGEQ